MVDRVVLITGGGSGLGRATSIELAAAGAHVLVTDIDERAAK
ncbi:MAG TPA: SDR family NAD(P)-dependent oxidoreductase, partial [Ilumatobacteraceae bacterium]|nr:SDR family NAD(P)-dependent oxidoreductase [Ilumatobacteraceae bacterium]